MSKLVIEKKNNETVAYVVDRFILAKLEYNQILDLSHTLKSAFDVSSEDEAETLVKNYLLSIGYVSTVD
ncbi:MULTISPECIES: hypothetical protein [unclassified Bacillus (in: firmicutes)]|uniref:hypothetical protein n=1 Tax=unclassified Bacillus (in: firmicutes) TaxID=185979 RepID=UPI001BE581D4|nr:MULTISPECIES: hypothetical protein [unclassified Bacillus (in: firmicutes)]MBT2615506.1 hypothetical protein [Bacillus sp. ISL-78]MBT2632335.1 hypothetical protein [Bacillus sp. ISL-101]MBT2719035.1 hypothetical protein [Bacillus sp. ISL-57]